MANSSTSAGPCQPSEKATFRLAGPEDAPGIRSLLRDTPLGGRITLTYEIDPDPRGTLHEAGRSHAFVVTRPSAPQTILALADRTVHSLWLDGQKARVGYIGQLRLRRGENITLRRLHKGFALFESQRQPDEHRCDYTSIFEGNTLARRVLERGLPGVPLYQPVGTLHTLTCSAFRAAAGRRDQVQLLAPDHRQEALDFLNRTFRNRHLSPCLGLSVFDLPGTSWFVARRENQIVGCISLWDQRAFKSISIRNYSTSLRLLRTPLNLLRRLGQCPPLPRIGTRLPLAFLSFPACADDDIHTLRSLISAAAAEARTQGVTYLNLGLPDGHPALPVLARSLRPEITRSIIYLVRPPGSREMTLQNPFPVHPEVALL